MHKVPQVKLMLKQKAALVACATRVERTVEAGRCYRAQHIAGGGFGQHVMLAMLRPWRYCVHFHLSLCNAWRRSGAGVMDQAHMVIC